MALTLSELVAGETTDAIKARILALLNTRGFPVTDWASGGVERTNVEAFVTALYDLTSRTIPAIAKNAHIQNSSGDWTDVVAEYWFGLTRQQATYTVQNVTLACSTGTGPYSLTAGQIIVRAASGNRYILDQAGTVPLSSSATLRFKAESPGGTYADGAGTITELVTPLPGLSCSNPAPDFSTVAVTGTGYGTIALSRTVGASPLPVHSYRVRIDTTGQLGVATFSYSIDGAPYVSAGATAATFDIPSVNVRLTMANGSVNPSFIAGDVYAFSTPGTPIVTQGVDTESDLLLIERCLARWPELSAVPNEDVFETWARRASIEVTKVRADPSPTVGGQVDIIIAGRVNPVSGTVVNTVQSYVSVRAGITDLPVVAAAAAVPIEAGGTVTVRAADLVAVQTAAQAAWDQYIADLPIGGSLPGNVVRLEELTEALMDAGAIDVANLTLKRVGIDSAGSPQNAVLTVAQVAATSSTLAATLSWVVY